MDTNRLLFRAKTAQIVGNYNWGVPDGTWVEGTLRNDTGKWIIYQFELDRADYVPYEIDPDTICQCTGLRDKNDKLIFENDMIEKEFYTDYDAHANSEKYKGVIKFDNFAWVVETNGDNCKRPLFEAMAYTNDIKHFEVTGNILDHPELLKNEMKQQEDVELDDDLDDEYEIPFA